METQIAKSLPTIAEGSRVHTKWRDGALLGFVAVPDALLTNQANLALSHTEMVVLLNVLSYWWFEDRKPFPRTSVIAKRIGSTTRTVQRVLENLETKGILKRTKNENGRKIFDPTPLVSKVENLARRDPRFPAL